MNSEVLKRDLFERVIDGVKVLDVWEENVLDIDYTSQTYDTKCVGLKVCIDRNERFKPILFSTSALTKPIQIASYNNGEPFVPILEILGKLNIYYYSYELMDNSVDIVLDAKKHRPNTRTKEARKVRFWFYNFKVIGFYCSDMNLLMYKDIEGIFNLLNQWHINYRLSPDQFIEVTDSFNPYK